MCLVAIAWQAHPDFPLLISANRDEFFERPTKGIHQWESGFYGGKDLRSGGTWLGFHPNGRWALLTNYRDFFSQRKAQISRGKLVQSWLESEISPEAYLEGIKEVQDQYEGFNLLVSDGKDLWYLSNYAKKIQNIEPGIHGLSNGLINAPWPKTDLAKAQLKDIINKTPSEDDLLSILKSTDRHPLDQLPKTGIPPEMEIGLSSQLVRLGENYGTVSATAVIQEKDGLIRMKERKFDFEYRNFNDREISFSTL